MELSARDEISGRGRHLHHAAIHRERLTDLYGADEQGEHQRRDESELDRRNALIVGPDPIQHASHRSSDAQTYSS